MNLAKHFSRRRFLQGAAAAALPAWFLEAERSYAVQPAIELPNERPNMALIGCGGMGQLRREAGGEVRQCRGIATWTIITRPELASTIPRAKTYKDFASPGPERHSGHSQLHAGPLAYARSIWRRSRRVRMSTAKNR